LLGWVDECVECFPGDTQECGVSDVGVCSFGEEECVAGYWGSCVGAVFSGVEICDGLDNDCDGSVDEGISCCEDECVDGESVCVDINSYQVCRDYDGDGCTEWSYAAECGYQSQCIGGYCT